MNRYLSSCLLLTLCFVIDGCQTKRAAEVTYEYRMVKHNPYPGDLQKLISQMADKGWEYVPAPPASNPDVFIVFRKSSQ